MDANDAHDVIQAQAGDEPAFRRLVERHGRGVFQLAFRLTGSETDAEDVVQDTFLKAYRELKRFEARSSFKTWIHRITVNCAYDLLRQRPRHKAESLDAAAEAEPTYVTRIFLNCQGSSLSASTLKGRLSRRGVQSP